MESGSETAAVRLLSWKFGVGDDFDVKIYHITDFKVTGPHAFGHLKHGLKLLKVL